MSEFTVSDMPVDATILPSLGIPIPVIEREDTLYVPLGAGASELQYYHNALRRSGDTAARLALHDEVDGMQHRFGFQDVVPPNPDFLGREILTPLADEVLIHQAGPGSWRVEVIGDKFDQSELLVVRSVIMTLGLAAARRVDRI